MVAKPDKMKELFLRMPGSAVFFRWRVTGGRLMPCPSKTVRSNRFYRTLLMCGLGIVILRTPLCALNPDRRISQYAHSVWRLQDGFLGSAASGIAQTTDGYVWVGTRSGIERFDGVRFVHWTPTEVGEPHSEFGFKLLGTSDGSLWIGTTGSGLWRWKNQQLTRYLSGIFSEVSPVVEGEHGSVWVTFEKMQDHSGAVCEVGFGPAHCYGESDRFPQS
jgi:hypothetical protein